MINSEQVMMRFTLYYKLETFARKQWNCMWWIIWHCI